MLQAYRRAAQTQVGFWAQYLAMDCGPRRPEFVFRKRGPTSLNREQNPCGRLAALQFERPP
jgi:hypothetical protein